MPASPRTTQRTSSRRSGCRGGAGGEERRRGGGARGGSAGGGGATSSWIRSGVRRPVVRDPVGIAVLVDVDVVELDAPQLLREHVRFFAVAAGAVDDDRLRLLLLVAALGEELVDLLVDVGFPDGERPRAGDVTLFVDRGAPSVEEEHAGVVESVDVVVFDLDVGL